MHEPRVKHRLTRPSGLRGQDKAGKRLVRRVGHHIMEAEESSSSNDNFVRKIQKYLDNSLRFQPFVWNLHEIIRRFQYFGKFSKHIEGIWIKILKFLEQFWANKWQNNKNYAWEDCWILRILPYFFLYFFVRGNAESVEISVHGVCHRARWSLR